MALPLLLRTALNTMHDNVKGLTDIGKLSFERGASTLEQGSLDGFDGVSQR